MIFVDAQGRIPGGDSHAPAGPCRGHFFLTVTLSCLAMLSFFLPSLAVAVSLTAWSFTSSALASALRVNFFSWEPLSIFWVSPPSMLVPLGRSSNRMVTSSSNPLRATDTVKSSDLPAMTVSLVGTFKVSLVSPSPWTSPCCLPEVPPLQAVQPRVATAPTTVNHFFIELSSFSGTRTTCFARPGARAAGPWTQLQVWCRERSHVVSVPRNPGWVLQATAVRGGRLLSAPRRGQPCRRSGWPQRTATRKFAAQRPRPSRRSRTAGHDPDGPVESTTAGGSQRPGRIPPR